MSATSSIRSLFDLKVVGKCTGIVFNSMMHRRVPDQAPSIGDQRQVFECTCSAYNRWQVNGHNFFAPDHDSNVSTRLSPEVAAQVEEVYLHLGHRDLLSRCLRNTTQNRNESLHARVWAKCPKTGFVGMQRVLFATCLAVSEFNSGAAVPGGSC